jgi:hypothetical protein
MISAAIKILGFDPIQLAAIPSGFVLLYLFVITAGLAAGMLVLRSVRPSRLRTVWLVTTVVVGAFGTSVVRTDLLKEYPNTIQDLDGGLPPRAVVVPLPLPGLRTADARDHEPGGKLWDHETYKPLQDFVFGPSNILATYVTMLLQLVFLLLALAGAVALSIEGSAAIFQKRRPNGR